MSWSKRFHRTRRQSPRLSPARGGRGRMHGSDPEWPSGRPARYCAWHAPLLGGSGCPARRAGLAHQAVQRASASRSSTTRGFWPRSTISWKQTLTEAMVDCLDFRQRRESSLAQEQHAIVMRRFRRVVEEYPEEPLYIPEICKAIRVPDRTLRLCCQEHLGMGPKRYLLLRRMHLVRRALRQAATDETSVTDIATRYGFWHLGRFADEYHSLFDESPSATLCRQSA
jgi:AraC-like DNA-binding protein